MPYYSLHSTLKLTYDVVIEIQPTICKRIEIICGAVFSGYIDVGDGC